MGTRVSTASKALAAGVCAAAIAGSVFGAQDKVDYSGSWKANCEDPVGLLIKPLRGGLYSISFCKSTVCAPGAYRPDTRIDNDPHYEVLSPTRIRLKHPEGGHTAYVKCSSETNPGRAADKR
jgi:hypothetical protein